ncbi:hypothetical protein [Candidatus Synechococcus spongiarum]|uniref:hypothetical protein n=1 Tax=Candidatus Synechococcus spongiarum TaxID=431041 RepID=UPI0004701634|nr:hypothetical protein [Candidatus Synechococcus spongiarum]
MDHHLLQPTRNEDGPAALSTPTASPAPADNPAGIPAEDRPAAGEGEPLEFPLQERHHQIISAFMAEHRRDSSSDNCSNSRLPYPQGLRRLAAGLRRWWAQR